MHGKQQYVDKSNMKRIAMRKLKKLKWIARIARENNIIRTSFVKARIDQTQRNNKVILCGKRWHGHRQDDRKQQTGTGGS